MNKVVARKDDFEKRRTNVKDLTDEQLKERFWQLANQIVEPLVELSKKNTSASIERSILLRMGFSSLEAKSLVERLEQLELLKYGAGHCVYAVSKEHDKSIREAGLYIIEGKYNEFLNNYFVRVVK